MANWVKLDLSICDNPPEFISQEDRCFYLRDYLVDKANHTPAWKLNPVVSNFKIKPTELTAKPSRARYKRESTEIFARELAALITRPVVLAAVPGSKTVTHADFDDRLAQVLLRAQTLNSNIHLVTPFTRTVDIESRHTTYGVSRSPQIHLDSITCAGIPASVWPVINGSPGNELYLVDDVLTSGSSFRACKQLLLADHPGLTIGGIFWARTKPILGFPGTDIEAIAKAVGLPPLPPKQR